MVHHRWTNILATGLTYARHKTIAESIEKKGVEGEKTLKRFHFKRQKKRPRRTQTNWKEKT